MASRADLEQATGLSRGTVASIVADLRREGILQPVGGPDDRRRVQGRPPSLLRLAAPAGLALAVDVGHRHVRVALGDANGVIVEERFSELGQRLTPADTLAVTAALVSEVMRAQGLTPPEVRGRPLACRRRWTLQGTRRRPGSAGWTFPAVLAWSG